MDDFRRSCVPLLLLLASLSLLVDCGWARAASASWFQSGQLVDYRCGLTYAPPALRDRVVALPLADFAGSAACGRCVVLNCTDARCGTAGDSEIAPVKAMVVDACNDCEENEIDLDQGAFYAVTRQDLVEVGGQAVFVVDWDFVECSADIVVGGIKLQLHPSTSSVFFAVKIENSMQPVESVTLIKGFTEYQLERTHENYFEIYFPDGARLTNPYSLEIRSASGVTLRQDLYSFGPDSLISTELQFGGGPTPVPEPPSRYTSAGTLYGGAFDIRDLATGVSFDSNEWWMQWNDGFIETDVEFPGESLLQIEMAGDRGVEWPRVNIYLDGGDTVIAENLEIASAFAEQNYTFYNFTIIDAGVRPLKIEFTNDYFAVENGLVFDCNLYVRRVIVTQRSDEYVGPGSGLSPSSLLAASFAATSGGGREVQDHRGNLYSINTRGWIQHEFDAGSEAWPLRIDIEAQSNLVNSEWAIMQVVINQQIVGEKTVETPSGFANFSFFRTRPLSGRFDLRIAYLNGYAAQGIRALVLNRIYLSPAIIEGDR